MNQALRYHVKRNQKGWVRALPRVRFNIMNTINSSTGFTPFQLKMGRSPRLVPPLVSQAKVNMRPEEVSARSIIQLLTDDIMQAQANLLQAKVQQAFHANKHRGPEVMYNIGDKVMLTTLHRCNEYKRKDHLRVAKFMPRKDGPYTIVDTHPETSSYTLDLPRSPNLFPVFHGSELSPAPANDSSLFPSRDVPEPLPIMTAEGYEEQVVESIIDERKRGRGVQYLVRWKNFGPEHDEWLHRHQLLDNAALDDWEKLEMEWAMDFVFSGAAAVPFP